jgi:hypothetical protein
MRRIEKLGERAFDLLGSSAFVPLQADILVAVLLSFIDLTLHKTLQSAATCKADAVLLELD